MSSAAVMRPQALPANGLPSPAPAPAPAPYQAPAFDPKKHMCYTPPSKTFALSDLNLNPTNATSPVAITTPFPLLTEEGVHALRADIFRHEIVSKYGSLKYPGVYRIRGYGPDAPFTYALWKSETMRAACSAAAGVELELIMDYEIGQLNVQLDSSIDKNAPITDNLPPIIPPREAAAEVDANEKEDGLKDLVSAWHYDSYPWVCVMMLSDPIGMRGGETALRTSDGSIRKVAQPGMGYAVMMQGSVINHAALRCLGNGERITFVTSFRNRDVNKRDTSSLRTVKPISETGELFRQWGSYRMDVLSKRAQGIHEKLDLMKGRSPEEVTKLLSEWAEEQIEYLKHTITEMS